MYKNIKLPHKSICKLLFSLVVGLAFCFSDPSLTQAAQIFDMATTSHWNVRFDGMMTNEKIGYEGMTIVDLDNDGKKDLVFATVQDHIYVVYNSLIESETGTGNSLSLQSGSNYSIKFTGLTGLDYHITTADLKGDGKQALIIADVRASKNSRTNSGSVYVIYNDLLATFGTTPGTTVDLSNSANYNLRFDGALASHFFGYSITATDLRNSGAVDILVGAPGAAYNGSGAGAFYIINNALFRNIAGVGNTIDMATTSNWNVRFDGVAASSLGLRVLSTADFNSDGKQEIVVAAPNADNNSRTNSGSIYIIDSSTFFSIAGTNNTITLSSTGNYAWRFDGAAGTDQLNFTPLRPIAYLENASKPDLLIASFLSDNNSRNNSGSLFVIFNSLLPVYTGSGVSFDLASSSNYSLRFDGAAAGYDLGGWGNATFDMNNDGKNDLSIASQKAVANARTIPGSIYYVENSKLFSYSGKNIDMATEANYDRRYDGPLSNSWLGGGQQFPADMNGDGQTDIIFGGDQTPYDFVDAGSIYIIYNFPHTFSINPVASTQNALPVIITGSLTAANSSTVITGVQYQVDSSSPQGSWTACAADDGAFNSTSETFSCSVSSLSEGSHSVYLRAYDSNTSYTAVANIPSRSFTYDATVPTGSISIDSGASSTSSTSVTLTLSSTDNLAASADMDMIVSNDSSFTGASWENFSTTKTWTVESGVGTKTVYVKFRDAAGNESASYSDSITLITPTPTSSSTATPASVASAVPVAPGCDSQSPGEKAPWLYAASAQDAHSVLLYFTDASEPTDRYVLEFGTQSGNYPYGSTNIGGKGLRTYLVQSLSPNTSYYFRVRGGNGCATGSWSNEISAKTNAIEAGKIKTLIFESSSLEVLPKEDADPSSDFNSVQKNGYKVNVKVIDSKNKPIKGAKVTIHSKVQETKTDENGIARFSDVEPGDHKVLIAYSDYEGQQSLNLTGDVKEFNLNVTVQEKNVLFSPAVIVILGVMGVTILGLIVRLFG